MARTEDATIKIAAATLARTEDATIKIAAATLAFCLSTQSAWADCNLDKITQALEAPLTSLKRTDYLRHAFVEEGPFGIARRTTEFYYFCNGKPYVPSPNSTTVDRDAYSKVALAAKKLMLDDKDVASLTKGLER